MPLLNNDFLVPSTTSSYHQQLNALSIRVNHIDNVWDTLFKKKTSRSESINTIYRARQLTCRVQLASTFVDLEAAVDVEEDDYDPNEENLHKQTFTLLDDTYTFYRRNHTMMNLAHIETCCVNSIHEETISMLDGKVLWNALTFVQLITKVTTFRSIKAQDVMTIVCTR